MGVAQISLQCPKCAGQCAFDPATGALKCDSCGHLQEVPGPSEDAWLEIDYPSDAPDTLAAERDAYGCDTCGGRVVFEGPALSTRCAYCDGPIVRMRGGEAYGTMSLIPFQEGKDAAVTGARAWAAKRVAAPGDLDDAVAAGRVAALYAPFFTFDSKDFIKYSGTYSTGSGKNRRTKRMKGQFHTVFDDLLVPASPHITPLIRDGVIHDFDPAQLRSYDPVFLAGFPAEQHHLTVDEGLVKKRADKQVLIRNRIYKHAKRRLSRLKFNLDSSGIRYRRILLPVYITHYEHRGKPYKIVTCGLRGTTFGERPFSPWKLLMWSTWIAALALGFGVVYGLAGLP